MSTKLSQHLLKTLSSQDRRVFAAWRAELIIASHLLREAARYKAINASNTRDNDSLRRSAKSTISRMFKKGEVEPIQGSAGKVYKTMSPYADKVLVDESEMAMEANPYAAISHLSALVVWGATNLVPKKTYLTTPRDALACGTPPMGTKADDWLGLSMPRPFKPPKLDRFSYEWNSIKNAWYFGYVEKSKVRVMTLERTLLDGLRNPDLCGGIQEVLRAFSALRHELKPSLLVEYVNRFNIGTVRQRAGFVMSRVGIEHPEFSKWKRHARRGGSSRLLARAPFARTYDLDWALSINCSVEVLKQE